MGWEQRNNQIYYYMKLRYSSKVTSHYVGSYDDELTRDFAEMLEFGKERTREALEQKELIRVEKQKIRKQCQQEQQEYEQISNIVNEALERINSLVEAVLLMNNFHQHKYTWRKRRKATIKERESNVSNTR
ncbi:MAG: hypothetical protein FD167_202 [bacterium]|nr:MAG: hypothetical protein FD167_202 [bacterium]